MMVSQRCRRCDAILSPLACSSKSFVQRGFAWRQGCYMDTVLPSGDSTTQSSWLVVVVGLAADGCLCFFELFLPRIIEREYGGI